MTQNATRIQWTICLRFTPTHYWHDDVIKWNIFRVTGPLWGESTGFPVDSHHKGQWRVTLMLSLICAWTNDWASNQDAGNLRRHRAYYDVIVMSYIHVYPELRYYEISIDIKLEYIYVYIYIYIYIYIYPFSINNSSCSSTTTLGIGNGHFYTEKKNHQHHRHQGNTCLCLFNFFVLDIFINCKSCKSLHTYSCNNKVL